MSLIKCKECGKEISDQAPSCPHCGVAYTGTFGEGPVVTIQRTLKIWKAVKLTSWVVILSGIITFSADEGLGISIIVLGVIGLIVAKFGAWWTTG